MPKITLPDNNILELETPCIGFDVAKAISNGLAKKALAISVDGVLQDMKAEILKDASVEIITQKNDDPIALEILRHSASHVMAEAVIALFPNTKLVYGPSTADGFYYDMATEKPLTIDDFDAIQKKMIEIVNKNLPFVRDEVSLDDGLARVSEDKYKKDNADRAIAKGATSLSFYKTGDDENAFEDLCSGPHIPSTGKLKACFKLMSVAGSYWHGDQNSDRLTRLYGTCFADKKGLKDYLNKLEEAKKRDHRKIGKEMDLFHLSDENPGQIFWHPNGWELYRTVQDYVRGRLKDGHIEVQTPIMQPQCLWERSGHWAKYRDNMFITSENDRSEKEDAVERVFSIKPMNCPGHIEIFNNKLRSYRELPLRMVEFGQCVRYEPSGALHGIMRVRGFVQDDGHIFCTEEQIGDEVTLFCDLVKDMYSDFGFDTEKIEVKFSTRPEVRVGADEDWDRAEEALEKACKQAGLAVKLSPGEGAFYGPKLEFTLIDSLGREWQCGTIQVDYQLAGADRLNSTYIAEDGTKKHPIILHRAALGSLERFIGIMTEHYAGKFPLWLSPVQIKILPISDKQADYAHEVVTALIAKGIKAEADFASEKLGAKIRNARNSRAPYFAVVGENEMTDKTVSLQKQDGSKVGVISIDELIEKFETEISNKG